MISKIIKTVLGYGQVKSQPFFERLQRFSIHGMNFGMAHFESSGELEAMCYVHKQLTPKGNLVIFDVGANSGEYTTALHKLFGAKATIHSFEPLPATYEMLKSHVSGEDGIFCHNFGFGDKSSQLTLFHGGPGSTIASVYPLRSDQEWKADEQESILIRTIDDFCAETSIRHIDFLKLDIEGNEFQALTGAQNMISSDAVSYIQFEFGPRQIDSRTYFRDFYYMLKDRYRIYRIVRNGLHPIDQYSEHHELFGGTANYIAEYKQMESL